MRRVRATMTADWSTVDIEGILDRWTLAEVQDLATHTADALEELAVQAHSAHEPDHIDITLDRGELEAYIADRQARERAQ